jgi:hypothetical protein
MASLRRPQYVWLVLVGSNRVFGGNSSCNVNIWHNKGNMPHMNFVKCHCSRHTWLDATFYLYPRLIQRRTSERFLLTRNSPLKFRGFLSGTLLLTLNKAANFAITLLDWSGINWFENMFSHEILSHQHILIQNNWHDDFWKMAIVLLFTHFKQKNPPTVKQ